MQIGLLEDDTAIQEMIRLVLQDAGYNVTVYSSAEECLNDLFIAAQQQHTSPLNLLIVDWRLSGSMPGTEVIQQLRAQATYSSLPIILTTAATFNDADALRDMHVSLLEKPFAVDEVVDLIKSLV